MDVIVLAGGKVPEELEGHVEASERALIPVNGTPMIDWVLSSLAQIPGIGAIIVVTTPETVKHLGDRVTTVASGETLSGNLVKGAALAKSDQVLIVTADVPLATAETWQSLIEAAQQKNLEAAYPIVRNTTVEAQFPGGKRTYAPLKDGKFTGGNGFLMPRAKIQELESLIESGYSARKKPWVLARMLGPSFIFAALTKKLTIATLEAKMCQLLGCRAGAVEIHDAAIAFDVDKPSDLEIARTRLAKTPFPS